jgi:hypothetical protein
MLRTRLSARIVDKSERKLAIQAEHEAVKPSAKSGAWSTDSCCDSKTNGFVPSWLTARVGPFPSSTTSTPDGQRRPSGKARCAAAPLELRPGSLKLRPGP